MIILRQKSYADQDYAGRSTALGAWWQQQTRNIAAARMHRQHQRAQNQLNRRLDRLDKVGLNDKNKATVQQNIMGNYLNKIGNIRSNNSNSIGTTTKNTNPPIQNNSVKVQPNTPTNTPNQGIGLGGRIALGTAAIGATALVMGAVKRRMEEKKKRQEEEEERRRRRRDDYI